MRLKLDRLRRDAAALPGLQFVYLYFAPLHFVRYLGTALQWGVKGILCLSLPNGPNLLTFAASFGH